MEAIVHIPRSEDSGLHEALGTVSLSAVRTIFPGRDFLPE